MVQTFLALSRLPDRTSSLIVLNMASSFPSFLVSYLTYCTFIVLSKGEPLLGENVRNAKPDEFPYVVAIGDNSPQSVRFCTGTLISRWSVLTAAHCFVERKESDVRVTIGSLNLSLGKRYKVKKVTTYKQWVTGAKSIEYSRDDIAIVTLKKKANCVPAPILTFALDDLYNSVVRIAGWGLAKDGTQPAIMRTAVMKVESNEACSKHLTTVLNDTVDIPMTYFCTVADPHVVATSANSGGPIFNKRHQVVGIHAGTIPGPGVVASEDMRNLNLHLHQYRDFIKDVVQL